MDPRIITRRTALKLALGSTGLTANPLRAQVPQVASRVIDTHTHFYDPTRSGGVPWPPANSPLYRPVYPKDWQALAGKLGIHETIVIEASKLVEDNDWILNLAEKEKAIIGFIGNLQPAAPDFAGHLKRLATNPIFRGIRVSGASLTDNCAQPQFIAGLKILGDMDLTLDVNGPAILEPTLKLAAAVPTLRIVIDHCGSCGDAQKLNPHWKSEMAAIAKQPNVFCKVSALVEMTDSPPGRAPTDPSYYTPVLDHLWQNFGEDRLIFGSNWPVSDKGASYDVLFKIVSEYFSGKGSTSAEKYFWQNSHTAYKWQERTK